MKATEFRRKIKKAVDRVPDERLGSLADFVEFLTTPSLKERIVVAEKAFRGGHGVNWRKVRRDC